MGDRAELALQLTGGLRAAFQALQRAGDKACRAYGLSHRAHAALQAVDQGGPDGARPSEIAGTIPWMTPRRNCAGTTSNAASAPAIAEPMSAVAVMVGSNITPGRKRGF